jgi:hypothetical protein
MGLANGDDSVIINKIMRNKNCVCGWGGPAWGTDSKWISMRPVWDERKTVSASVLFWRSLVLAATRPNAPSQAGGIGRAQPCWAWGSWCLEGRYNCNNKKTRFDINEKM